MDFKEILSNAKKSDQNALETIYTMYKPLILRESMVDDALDDDLYQELWETFLYCIRNIKI